MDDVTAKRELLLSCLEDGLIMLHVDARHFGVRVPLHLKRDSHLRLNLSYDHPGVIITVGDNDVTANLSFNGQDFPCRMPLDAIFGVTSFQRGQLYLFGHDVPAEVREEWERLLEEELAVTMPPGEAGPKELTVQVVDLEQPADNADVESDEDDQGDEDEYVDDDDDDVEGEVGKGDAEGASARPRGKPTFRVIDGGRS